MLIDLSVVISLIVVFLILFRKHQFNALISSVSLILVVLLSKTVASSISSILTSNGFAREGYPIIISYLLIIIIAWGVLFSILTNFRTEFFDRQKILFTFISSILYSISFGIILCFSFFYIDASYIKDSKICRFCKMAPEDLAIVQNSSVVPRKLNDVISLEGDYSIQFESREMENEVLAKINYERTKTAKSPLKFDSNLKKIASGYAHYIVSSLRFSHLDANNNSPADRASAAGLKYTLFGENLAIAPDINQAHTALMNSEAHRANILSADFDKVGISAFMLKNGSIILVEEFSN